MDSAAPKPPSEGGSPADIERRRSQKDLAPRERLLGHVAAAVLLGALPSSAVSADEGQSVRITEWVVPWQHTRPRDAYVDGARRVWFTSPSSDYVAYLDPFSGKFKRFRLESGTEPRSLVVDGQGDIWYAGGNRAQAHIGKFDRRRELVFQFPMPNPVAQDPHSLTLDERGNIWFAIQGGNSVGRLDTRSGQLDLVELPTSSARPSDIAIDGKNRPWIAEYATNKLAVLDPSSMSIREFVLPRSTARPRRLCVSSADHIWYVDYAEGYVGRLRPERGTFQEWPVPGGRSARPYALARDARDRIWFVETGLRPSRLVGFDPRREQFFSITGIASGGTVRDMYYHEPSEEMWFVTDARTLGRAELGRDSTAR
ncbi:MAG: lyase [Gammaproteobacteria bacterium]|nr:lyase [Gammaproteobacteria bacterium]NIR83415.1 lyase [Gammaproteobacteria bacterium]NIR91337.1 lyase [Gammaproteobacteria bacterium]NIU04577.1 lyase [Gammaproteobacteria bacterium]NIV51619.1 lyase [Gammaproteobacteria bacterium]